MGPNNKLMGISGTASAGVDSVHNKVTVHGPKYAKNQINNVELGLYKT
jgi:hypothetical protein